MFHFKEETDAELVNQAFHASNNINWAHDDSFQGKFKIPYYQGWLYLSCFMDGEFMGCIFGLPDGEEIKLHMAFTKTLYGKTVSLGKLAIDWIKWNLPQFKTYSASIFPYKLRT